MCKESNENTKETQKNEHTKSTHESSFVVLMVCTCFRFASSLNMLLYCIVLLCVISSVVVGVPTYSLYTCM